MIQNQTPFTDLLIISYVKKATYSNCLHHHQKWYRQQQQLLSFTM